jgi:hypothetical protein
VRGGSFGVNLVSIWWTANGNPPAAADTETYMRFRHRSDSGGEVGIASRVSGANPNYGSGSYASYWVRGRIVGTSVLARYREYGGGAVVPGTENDWTTLSTALNVDIHMILRCVGSTISFKMWKEGDAEPAFTTLTDATITAAAAPALHWANGNDADIYFVGVGTFNSSTGQVDPAPRGGAPVVAGPVITGPASHLNRLRRA